MSLPARRRAAVVGLVLALAPSCGRSDDTHPSPSTSTTTRPVAVEYRVSRGDLADQAHIRYRLPGGEEVEADVSVPWESGRLLFAPDETLRLSASSSENELVSLQCEADTNQGPYGRTTGSSGTASCEFETPLPELAKR